jgi:Beta-lactamase superfamily domain
MNGPPSGGCCRIGRCGAARAEVTGVYSMASFGSCAPVRYPWQMRNKNQNLCSRWYANLWHEWIGERWRPIAPAFARPNPAEWSDNRITAAWLGHATVLINFFGIKILTDPVLYPRIGIRLPGLTVGPKRLTASALTVRDLPKIDIVLLSHAHFDHFDMRTLHRFHRSTRVITRAWYFRNVRRRAHNAFIQCDGRRQRGTLARTITPKDAIEYTPVTSTRATPQRPIRQQRPKPIHRRRVHAARSKSPVGV